MFDEWNTFKTYTTAPRAEEMAPFKMPLSREKLHGNYKDLIGESPVHLKILKRIDRFAKSDKIVLISGETGTGKELVAHALHAESFYAQVPVKVRVLASTNIDLIEANEKNAELLEALQKEKVEAHQ